MAVAGCGVLCGFSAAELLGARCAPADAPAEVHVGGGRRRTQPGLRVHRGLLLVDEVTTVDGIAVTTPARTAYDLGRRSPFREAVVAVDAIARVRPFDLSDVLCLRDRYLGARGSAQLARVIALANPLADSPMETRVRLAIVTDGLPVPVLQHPVGPYLLDLAYPGIRLGMEYDGRDHLTPERARRDLARQAYLTAAGWQVLRFSAGDVLNRPWSVAARVRAAMIAARDTSASAGQR